MMQVPAPSLLHALREVYGCPARFESVVPVLVDDDPGHTRLVTVSVLRLDAPSDGKRCFTWSQRMGERTQQVFALETDEIGSAEAALHAADSNGPAAAAERT